MTTTRARTFAVSVSSLVFALTCATVTAAAPVQAESPRELNGTVTDRAAAIGAETPKVQAAVDRLAKDSDLSLSVVYVKTFDGASPTDWARKTIALSSLGADDLVLVIATEDHLYAIEASGESSLSESEIRAVAREQVRPAVRKDDWAGAAIGAADGYRTAGGPGPPYGAIVGGAIIILGFAALLVRGIRRTRSRA